MPVTVKVNGTVNSLVHKGSNGISAATIPDVCKTPSPGGPVPIPYPNISQSATLAKGTTTVKADGGMMIAIKGSEFSLSNGDNAGVAGGVKSSTFMKESTWILYSFDVKMDGQNAARLTDKKFQNHQNTADLGGHIQNPTTVAELEAMLCEIWKECEESVNKKHGAEAADAKTCWTREGKKEPLAFKMSKEKHACCAEKVESRKGDAQLGTEVTKPLPAGGNVRLDVVAGKSFGKVYDFKFQCPKRATPPKWPLYKSKVKAARKPPHPDYDNMTQDQLIEEATGKSPRMINENCSPCKK
ncbi:hypothetical protein CLD22_14610 [Rubrivivax gelatinosus]|nr:hypothetical protein [Rubrivivax gelatinosus]